MRTRTRSRRAASAIAAVAALLTALSPSPAGAANIGAGVVQGTVSFNGAGVPLATEPCGPTSFTLSGYAAGVVLNTVITGHVGQVYLWGSGGSTCENTTTATGTSLTLYAWGYGPTGSTLSCSLVGVFVRAASAVAVDVSGDCTVNNFAAGRVRFLAGVNFSPTTGDGVTTRVRNADFEGAFSVIPA